MEEERKGQSTRFRVPGMAGKLGAALEASWMDGKLASAMGLELGAALEASWMDGKLVSAMGLELGAWILSIGSLPSPHVSTRALGHLQLTQLGPIHRKLPSIFPNFHTFGTWLGP